MRTYWLYYNNQHVTAVRLPEGASDQEVRDKAYKQNQDVSLTLTPYAQAYSILNSEIKIFE